MCCICVFACLSVCVWCVCVWGGGAFAYVLACVYAGMREYVRACVCVPVYVSLSWNDVLIIALYYVITSSFCFVFYSCHVIISTFDLHYITLFLFYHTSFTFLFYAHISDIKFPLKLVHYCSKSFNCWLIIAQYHFIIGSLLHVIMD